MINKLNFILGVVVTIMFVAIYAAFFFKKQVDELKKKVAQNATVSEPVNEKATEAPSESAKETDKGSGFTYDIYDRDIVLPFWKDTVYDLGASWVNQTANTSLLVVRYMSTRKDNAKIVVFCDRIDINGDYFRLHIIDPFDEMWTPKRKLNDSLQKAFADDINKFINKILVLEGYIDNKQFYITNINATNYGRFIA